MRDAIADLDATVRHRALAASLRTGCDACASGEHLFYRTASGVGETGRQKTCACCGHRRA